MDGLAFAAVCALALAQALQPAADGGFTTDEAELRTARRRVLELHLPATSDGPFVMTDSRSPETLATWSFVGAAALEPQLDQGAVRYRGVGARLQDAVVFQREDRSIGVRFGGGDVRLKIAFGGEGRTSPDGTLELVGAAGVTYRLRADVPLSWTGQELVLESPGPFLLTIELALVQHLIDPPSAQDPAWGAVMAWDGDHQRIVRVGGTGSHGNQLATWAWTGATGWVDLRIPSPPSRVRSAMVWDRAHHTMLLFGGSGSATLLDDTWELTGSGWVQRFPAQRPAPRWAHGLAYDERRERPVLFGGLQGDGSGIEFDDTWEWNGTNWELKSPATSPRGRDAHGLAWSATLGEVVLFGGWDGLMTLDDTWSWDGVRWRQLSPPTSPPPRSSLGMTWDPVAQRILMTGGWEPRSAFVVDDTWTFDGLTWTQRSPAPATWMRMALAPHPRFGVVAFGGVSGPVDYAWTLAHDGQAWRSLDGQPTSGPLVPRASGVTLLALGSEWTVGGRRWVRGQSLPFSEATHAVTLSSRSLALVLGDAGLETWLADVDGGPWLAAADVVPGLAERVATDLALDRAYLMSDDGGLSQWSGAAWSPVPLWPSSRSLGGALLGQVYLVEDDVVAYEPRDGGVSAFLPAPFPDAGRYTLQFDLRRDTIIASGGSSFGLFSEWDGQRWEPVSLQPVRTEWLVAENGNWLGWFGDAGLSRYEPARFNGAACFDSRQCASGVCADGVCCDRDCGSSREDCVACSVATGAERDGLCSPIRSGFEVRCGGDGACLVAQCVPGDPVCPTAVDVCSPDAGPPRDAGRPLPSTDAGTPGEPGATESCQCATVEPQALWWLLLALPACVRRRRIAQRLRHETSRDASTAP